jgi:hypothetical protein
LKNLFHPNQIPRVVVPFLANGYVEVDLIVHEIRMIFADIIIDPRGSKNRASEATADGILLRQHSRALKSVHEDTISLEK